MAEERKSWMKDGLTIVGTIAAYELATALFGQTAAMWLASVVLVGCICFLWGAGHEIRKHRLPAATIRENGRGEVA